MKFIQAKMYGAVSNSFIFSLNESIENPVDREEKGFIKGLREHHNNIYTGRDKNDSLEARDPEEIVFHYTPTISKQVMYKQTLPFLIDKQAKVSLIDAFACLGTKFDLKNLMCFVEIKKSEMAGGIFWAEIYYACNCLFPAAIIECSIVTIYS
jgi:hypothetical protein